MVNFRIKFLGAARAGLNFLERFRDSVRGWRGVRVRALDIANVMKIRALGIHPPRRGYAGAINNLIAACGNPPLSN